MSKAGVMEMRKFLAFGVVVAGSGCAFINPKLDEVSRLMNPQRIHVARDRDSEAYKASQLPIEDYYKAMRLARPEYTEKPVEASPGRGFAAQGTVVTAVVKKDRELIVNYVDEGIGLVDAFCIRWFQSLDDVSRLARYEDKNVNIITQLGTALLGTGGANPNIVAGYGAGTTAYAGFFDNFNTSFLTGPTSSIIKGHMDVTMRDAAAKLRRDVNDESFTFKQAYSGLERYADICTYNTVKAIIDNSLNATRTDIKDGQIQTTIDIPKAAAAAAAASAVNAAASVGAAAAMSPSSAPAPAAPASGKKKLN